MAAAPVSLAVQVSGLTYSSKCVFIISWQRVAVWHASRKGPQC